MSRHTRGARMAASILAAAVVLVLACNSKDDSPTSPGGGGGGGGGGPNFNSPILQSGGSFSFTFADSGAFGYRCGLHPGIMFGNSVTVTATSSVDSVVVNIVGTSTPGFSPSAATIKIGGTIRWVNVHNVPHSVERTS